MPRPKHNDKDLEQLLKEAEHKDWRIEGGGNAHFKLKCPCGIHKKTVATTPSSRYYEKRTRAILERETCWLQDQSEETS